MSKSWETVWITGASYGLGRELAVRLASEGARLAISARSEEPLGELALQEPLMTSFPLNVTDLEQTTSTIECIEKKVGPIDLAILNAGIWEPMRVAEFNVETCRKMLEVNYIGVVNALESLLPRMIARGRGHIAIIASVAAYRGIPNAVAYGPSKAALQNLVECLKLDLDKAGVDLSLVNPSFIATPMTAKNNFPMPFIMPVEKAAEKIIKGLKKKKYEIAFPFLMAWGLRISQCIPHALYFWVIKTFIEPGHRKEGSK